MGRHVLPFLAVVAALCAGCDRNFEPYVEGEQAEEPDLSRIFPPGAEQAAQRARPAAMPQPTGGRGAPPVSEAADPIEGTVSVTPELADGLPDRAVLFLIARTGDAGPPLAVLRIAEPRFPLDFSIGPDDRMIPSLPFVGPLRLTARLDGDGNASTRAPGDLQGVADGAYQPGATDVRILLDRRL